jgi:hypothetical protein
MDWSSVGGRKFVLTMVVVVGCMVMSMIVMVAVCFKGFQWDMAVKILQWIGGVVTWALVSFFGADAAITIGTKAIDGKDEVPK